MEEVENFQTHTPLFGPWIDNFQTLFQVSIVDKVLSPNFDLGNFLRLLNLSNCGMCIFLQEAEGREPRSLLTTQKFFKVVLPSWMLGRWISGHETT